MKEDILIENNIGEPLTVEVCKDTEIMREIFTEYSRIKGAESCFRSFDAEIADLNSYYEGGAMLLGSFGGAYLNFYYSIPMYDKILHATGTAEGVYIGYEYTCALQLKYKKTCPPQIASLCGLGFGFILASGWELFEFIYDQFFGGDAQHWNLANALKEAGGNWQNVFLMFPLRDYDVFLSRFALMDTMSDIVMNFIGGLIMYAVLFFFPYRHRGAGDVNALIESQKE